MDIRDGLPSDFAFIVLDRIPDPVIWVFPVMDETGQVTDFEVKYSNIAADQAINHPAGSLQGLLVRKDGVPSMASSEQNFRNFLDVFEHMELKEHRFFAHHSGREFETVRQVVNGGVLSTVRDRKAQREAERKELEKTRLLDAVIANAPVGLVAYTAVRNEQQEIIDFEVKLYNQVLHDLSGIDEQERRSLSFRALLQILEGEELFGDYRQTVETGIPFSRDFFNSRVDRWLHLSVVKLDDGFLMIISDISAIKNSEQALQQQSDYLNSILNASLSGVFSCEAVRDSTGKIIDLRYQQINDMFLHMTGKKEAAEVIGHTMLELFPATLSTGVFERHCRVIESGVPARFDLHYKGEGLDAWYDIASVRVGDNGVVITFADITEQKRIATEIEEQRNLLDNILKHSSNGISVSEMIRDKDGTVIDARTILANDAAVQYTGLPRELYLSRTAVELDPGIIGSPYYHMCIHTLETGEPSVTQYLLELTGKWLELTVSRMDEEHLIHIFTDVTKIRQMQQESERNAARLQTVFHAAQAGMFTFLPEFDERGTVVDFRFGMVNARMARYVGQEPEALKGALGSTWFPGYLTNGLFDMYRHTFLTGEPQRQNIHYNVDGHDLHLDLQSIKSGDEVLVTFTDHSALRQAQLQLEQTVEALKRSNAYLEEFAHAASHDLKEPIRKIHTFAGRLRKKLSERISPEEAEIFERMENATDRMNQLVEDLLSYSRVSTAPKEKEPVDLNQRLELVLQDLEMLIEEKGGTIEIGKMPVVPGFGRHLQQLFQNLIGNALKYSKPDVPPVIKITHRIAAAEELPVSFPGIDQNARWHLFEVTDNGIGFEQQYAERIFQMFKRLHGKTEFSGTGVGLSIVRKVAENHGGYVAAKSSPGSGATFYVVLPLS